MKQKFVWISWNEILAMFSLGHNMEIVETLRQMGQVVTMAGDGVNDSPALEQMDIKRTQHILRYDNRHSLKISSVEWFFPR